MRDPHYEYDERVILDFVNHAIITDSYAPQATEVTFQDTSHYGVFGQGINCTDNPELLGLRDACQFLGGAAFNPYRVGHA